MVARQAWRKATESLANALDGALFFLFLLTPTPLFAAHCSLFLFGPRTKAKSHSSLVTERPLQWFSHPGPCALTGPALLMAVTCSLGQTIHGGLFHSLLYSCSCSVFVCVHACLWSGCWRYPIPVIVHLTRIPGGMRVRVEHPDSMYRCSASVWKWRKTREGQM